MALDFEALLRAERAKAKNSKRKKAPLLAERKKINIEEVRLPNLETIYYIKDFISQQEEDKLLNAIYAETSKPWINLSQRRLKNLGGVPHHKGLILEELPEYCAAVATALKQTGFNVDYNQVLLNEYENGKGIDLHKDGPLYFPLACVLSLESYGIIEFYTDKVPNYLKSSPAATLGGSETTTQQAAAQCVGSVILEPRSLLVFTDKAYTDLYHGLRDTPEDIVMPHCINAAACGFKVNDKVPRDDRRVSLTIRSCANAVERSFSTEEAEELKRRERWWVNSIDEKY